MLSRFNVRPVLFGHWKGLTDGRYRRYKPDWSARAILCIPFVLTGVMWGTGGDLAAPTPLLTAVSLLAGGMLSAFTHLSTLRLKITEWLDKEGDEGSNFEVEREMLDETASHLLTGSLLCAIDALLLVVGLNFASSPEGHLTGVFAAIASGVSSYIFLVFVMIVPRLYSAYVEINKVSSKLNGFVRSK